MVCFTVECVCVWGGAHLSTGSNRLATAFMDMQGTDYRQRQMETPVHLTSQLTTNKISTFQGFWNHMAKELKSLHLVTDVDFKSGIKMTDFMFFTKLKIRKHGQSN